jgi:hypothetical protein
MKRKTEIKQNEMAVTKIVTGKEVIQTPGVSTFICIAAKGQFGTHPFMALFHRDGFDYDTNICNAETPIQRCVYLSALFT